MRGRTRVRRRALRWYTPLVVLGVLLPTIHAGAITLMTIQGRVTDAMGRPVAGANVSDGGQQTWTDSDGRYVLEEDRISDYVVTVSKVGFDVGRRTVTPVDALSSVDFQLLYSISMSTDPLAFNNDPPKTIQVTVRSYAPPESCINWADQATGQQSLLALVEAVPGGQSRWAGSFDVPAASADSVYTHTAIAKDCDLGTALTASATGTYVIDSVAPELSPISPLDSGNVDVTLGGLPIVARVTEALSGTDPSSVSVTVDDLMDPQGPSGVSRTLTGDVIRSELLTLTAGHRYQAVIEASDNAGNVAEPLALVFSALDVTIPSIDAVIPDTEGEAGDLTLDGGREFTFRDVELSLSSYAVTVYGSPGHAGFGFFGHSVDLQDAKIHFYKTLGDGTAQELPGSPVSPPPTWGSRMIYTQATVTTSDSDLVLPLDPVYTQMPELTATISALADKAVLRMDADTTPFEAVCADPTAVCPARSYPTPDPFPYYFAVQEADALNMAANQALANARADVASLGGVLCYDTDGVEPCVYPQLSNVSPGLVHLVVLSLDPDDPFRLVWQRTTPVPAQAQLAMWGLSYSNNYPVHAPANFSADCTRRACSQPAAEANFSSASVKWCADDHGNIIEGNEQPCYQHIKLTIEHRDPATYAWGTDGHRFVAWMGATYGFFDADKDNMMMAVQLSDNFEPDWMQDRDYTQRSYYRSDFLRWDVDGQPVCYHTVDEFFEEDESRTREFASHWYGKEFINLKQWTRYYSSGPACQPADYTGLPKNRLWFAYVAGSAPFSAGSNRGNRLGYAKMTYGHRKKALQGSWSCGPGVGAGGLDFGCSYSVAQTETDSWVESSPKIEFRY